MFFITNNYTAIIISDMPFDILNNYRPRINFKLNLYYNKKNI